jgi:hypothetical protein
VRQSKREYEGLLACLLACLLLVLAKTIIMKCTVWHRQYGKAMLASAHTMMQAEMTAGLSERKCEVVRAFQKLMCTMGRGDAVIGCALLAMPGRILFSHHRSGLQVLYHSQERLQGRKRRIGKSIWNYVDQPLILRKIKLEQGMFCWHLIDHPTLRERQNDMSYR